MSDNLGEVARNPRQAKLIEHSRNILVFYINSTERRVGPRLATPRLSMRPPEKISRKHGEVVGDDRIDFVILPIRPNPRFISHLIAFVAARGNAAASWQVIWNLSARIPTRQVHPTAALPGGLDCQRHGPDFS